VPTLTHLKIVEVPDDSDSDDDQSDEDEDILGDEERRKIEQNRRNFGLLSRDLVDKLMASIRSPLLPRLERLDFRGNCRPTIFSFPQFLDMVKSRWCAEEFRTEFARVACLKAVNLEMWTQPVGDLKEVEYLERLGIKIGISSTVLGTSIG
jgi:hypothetical protein